MYLSARAFQANQGSGTQPRKFCSLLAQLDINVKFCQLHDFANESKLRIDDIDDL